MRYLITGAQGFVGRYLTAAILRAQRDAEVLGIGRSECLQGFFSHFLNTDRHKRAKLPEDLRMAFECRYRYVAASVLDEATMISLIREFRPDCIFHLASGLRGDDQQRLLITNIHGTTSLMNALASANTLSPTLIIGSSGGVYGQVKSHHLPLNEAFACEPNDVYSFTKLAAEQVARLMGRSQGLRVITARIFNIVGPGQDERHVCGRFAAQLQELAYRGWGELTVGNIETTRDFIDVRDVASALLLLAASGEADQVYNVGSGVETSISQVLEMSLDIWGHGGGWRSSGAQLLASDVSRHFADTERLRSLGFKPQHDLRASLSDIAGYYRGAL